MATCAPLVTDHDKQQLIDRIRLAGSVWSTYRPRLDAFREGLREARGVPPSDVPPDAITMNSRFAVMDLRSGETICYTLVYPEDEALEAGKLCVLSPMGMALLGARAGDVVRWNRLTGAGAVEVLRILYQPEAAGDHHL